MREFSSETETISSHQERLDLFFEANSVAAGKQVSFLLTVIHVGSKHYDLLRGLVALATLKDRMLKELHDLIEVALRAKTACNY